MKAYLVNNHINLEAENEQEAHFLDVLDKNGAKVCIRGTNSIGITSPHVSGLKQLFVTREQQAIVANAIGITEMNLLTKIIVEGDQAIPHYESLKIASEIGDLKSQLFTKPDQTPARLVLPKRTKRSD